jgi:glucose/arabinose dehydrogenase
MKKRDLILLSVLVVCAVVFGILLMFIRANTSFINFNIPSSEIVENNQSTLDSTDYGLLVERELEVPALYKKGEFASAKILNIPENFKISLFAGGLNGPRFIDFTAQNNIILTDQDAGKLLLLTNSQDLDYTNEIIEIDTGLRNPHGIDYYEGDLYVAEETQVVRYSDLQEDGEYTSKTTIISELPTGGHVTRTVVIGPDEKLYLSIGSSCNVCVESDYRRAAIMRYDLDGSNEEVFATGLRNTPGFVFEPAERFLEGYRQFGVQDAFGKDFLMWGVDMGRDLIGDDLPVEEVNIIGEGGNYGWPYCHGAGVVNPEYSDRQSFCTNQTVVPAYEMQAHSAPIGLSFISEESQLPDSFMQNLFVAFHGSWNRTVPTGYKVVRIDTSEENSEPVNFVTGWLGSDGKAWGRPVDIKFDANSSIFITDDRAGAVYKVFYIHSRIQ